MACTAPDLVTPVVLATGYSAPDLAARGVILSDCTNAAGWLDATAGPIITAPTFVGTGEITELAGGQGWLDASITVHASVTAPVPAVAVKPIPEATLAAADAVTGYVTAPSASNVTEYINEVALGATQAVAASIIAPTATVSGDPGERPQYWRPSLALQVTLQGDYTPPVLPGSVTLCLADDVRIGYLGATISVSGSIPAPTAAASGDVPATATATATTAAPITPPTAEARERPPGAGAESLYVKAPAPPHATPAGTAQGDLVLPAPLAATTAPTITPPTARIFERILWLNISAQTSPIIIAPSATASGDVLPTFYASVTTAPPEPIAPSMVSTVTLQQDLELVSDEGPGFNVPSNTSMQKTTNRMGMCIDLAALKTQTRLGVLFTAADPITVPSKQPTAEMVRFRREAELDYQEAIRVQTGAEANYAEMIRTRRNVSVDYQEAIRFRGYTSAHYAEMIRLRQHLLTEHDRKAESLPAALGICRSLHGQPVRTLLHWCYTDMDDPAPGRWWPKYETPGLNIILPCTGDYTPRDTRCMVVLGHDYAPQPYCPEAGDPLPTTVVPIQEIYVVINSFSLARTSDGTVLSATDFSASLDYQSWAWSWSARIPASQLSLIAAPSYQNPVEVTATINGTALRLVVEQIRRERRFGSGWVTIGGRSPTAWLAAPYAVVEARNNAAQQYTAQQLMNEVLKINGVSMGWTVTWGLEDWNVPAGAWAHRGTYIEALARIAEAGGGYLQPHDTADEVIVLPRYEYGPWDWGVLTPKFDLPDSVVEVEGIEWRDAAPYNAVYIVGGTTGGRKDRVVIQGGGMDTYAPTVVDPLATDTIMTRQRGLAVLGDTGRQAHVTLRLPVLAETDIIRPGDLVDYTAEGTKYRGLVRSVNVQTGHPDIWQTIKVESHV